MAALTALAIAGAAAGAYGAHENASAIKKATAASTAAANTNNAIQADVRTQNVNALTPYITQGNENSGRLNALLATNPYDFTGKFEADPGYQFRLNEGLRGVTQNKATAGLLKSGSALKALNDYAQGQASQEYGNAFNRYQAQQGGYINALSNQQGVGLSAANALAGVGTNYANSVSANNNNAANTAGNAALAGASNTGSLIGQGINALSYYAGSQGGGRGSSYSTPTPKAAARPADPLAGFPGYG